MLSVSITWYLRICLVVFFVFGIRVSLSSRLRFHGWLSGRFRRQLRSHIVVDDSFRLWNRRLSRFGFGRFRFSRLALNISRRRRFGVRNFAGFG